MPLELQTLIAELLPSPVSKPRQKYRDLDGLLGSDLMP